MFVGRVHRIEFPRLWNDFEFPIVIHFRGEHLHDEMVEVRSIVVEVVGLDAESLEVGQTLALRFLGPDVAAILSADGLRVFRNGWQASGLGQGNGRLYRPGRPVEN